MAKHQSKPRFEAATNFGKICRKKRKDVYRGVSTMNGSKGRRGRRRNSGNHFTTYFSFDLFLFSPVWSSEEKEGVAAYGIRHAVRAAERPPPPFFVFSSSKVCPRCAEGRKRDKGRESSINRRRTYTSKAAPLSKLGEISEFRSMAGGGGGGAK